MKMEPSDQELIKKLKEKARDYANDAAAEEKAGNTITAAMYRKYERHTQVLIDKMEKELGKGDTSEN